MNNVLRFIFLVISFTLFSAVPLSAQTQKEISLDVENEALAKVFKRIEKQCDYKIMYATDDVKAPDRRHRPRRAAAPSPFSP